MKEMKKKLPLLCAALCLGLFLSLGVAPAAHSRGGGMGSHHSSVTGGAFGTSPPRPARIRPAPRFRRQAAAARPSRDLRSAPAIPLSTARTRQSAGWSNRFAGDVEAVIGGLFGLSARSGRQMRLRRAGIPGRQARFQLLFNHPELFWRSWGLSLAMVESQRCERISGATLCLMPGSTCSTRSTTRCAGAPQDSGDNNAPVATSPSSGARG